jgi:hypothetical protein
MEESNKKNQAYWSVFVWGLLISFVALEVLRAKWKVCLPEGDCESYIAMVSHWGYSADILPHHAMRILPSILVSLLTGLGISTHFGFWLLSTASFVLFAFGFYKLLANEQKASLLPLGLTFLVLSAHWAMTYSLSNFYQATDALTYPLGLLMFWQLSQHKSTQLFLTGLLGCLVRQNLFVMGFLGLLQIFTRTRRASDLLKCLGLGVGYMLVTRYYQASGALAAHLIPPASYLSPSVLWSVWQASDLTWLLMPCLPLLLINLKGVVAFFKRYPAVLFYGLIVTAQPFIAFEMTGQANFVRIAMQGVWPLYLAASYAVMSTVLSRSQQLFVFMYSALIASTYSHSFRATLVLLACGIICVSYLRKNHVPQIA